MKLFLINGTRFRTSALRRAIRAAAQEAGWPSRKPIYVGCWPGSTGYRLLDVGVALHIGARRELWELADLARFALRVRMGGDRRKSALTAAQALAWRQARGVGGGPGTITSKSSAARRLRAAKGKAPGVRQAARLALAAYASRRGGGPVAELGAALAELERGYGG